MLTLRTLIPIALGGTLLGAASASAQAPVPDPVIYALKSSESQFEWGCFDPCACPIMIREPLTGSFVLHRSHADPLFTVYDVRNLRLRVSDGAPAIEITGSGTYRRGGEFALLEQLKLDVSFNGGPTQHFDSGLVPPAAAFPELKLQVSLHSTFCLDSVLTLDAIPIGPASTDDGRWRPALSAAPNPFDATTEIAFTLPRDGIAKLDVFDLGGRRLRQLVSGEPLPAGTHVRSWDGRLGTGAVAPSGLYLLRLDTPWGRSTRIVAKLN